MARVLVVDDDPDLVDACRLVLEDTGHTVDTVTDAAVAAERAHRWRPDVVLLDWVLDGITGGEVLRALRRDGSLGGTAVIVMSALQGGATQAHAAGADAFLSKPFRVDALMDRVEQVCRRRQGCDPHPPAAGS